MCKYLFLTLVLLNFILTASAEEDSLSFATYYPAPYGNYREMRAMRMAIGDNYIKTNNYDWETGATNLIDSSADLIVEGNVGIGITSPRTKLDVAGGITLGNDTSSVPGTIRWDSVSKEFQGYNGTKWVSFSTGGGTLKYQCPDLGDTGAGYGRCWNCNTCWGQLGDQPTCEFWRDCSDGSCVTTHGQPSVYGPCEYQGPRSCYAVLE